MESDNCQAALPLYRSCDAQPCRRQEPVSSKLISMQPKLIHLSAQFRHATRPEPSCPPWPVFLSHLKQSFTLRRYMANEMFCSLGCRWRRPCV